MRRYYITPDFSRIGGHPEMKKILGEVFDRAGAGRLPKKSVVLDIGGGAGAAGEVIAARYRRNLLKYVNLDVDEEMLAGKSFLGKARELTSKSSWLRGLAAGRSALKVAGDRSRLPFPNRSAKLALLLFPAQSFLPQAKANRVDRYEVPFLEALRVLKKGGKIVFVGRSDEETVKNNIRGFRKFLESTGFSKEVYSEMKALPPALSKEFEKYDGAADTRLHIQVFERTKGAEGDKAIGRLLEPRRKIVAEAEHELVLRKE